MTLSAIANNAERSLVIVADIVLAAAASPAVHTLKPAIAASVIGAQHIALIVLAGLSAAPGGAAAEVAPKPVPLAEAQDIEALIAQIKGGQA
jgi:hypothetical protein